MDITERDKIIFLVRFLLRTIMGTNEKTENIIKEVLADNYTHEKMRSVISDFDNELTAKAIAVLAGNATVCNTLNNISGSAEEKQHIIANQLWTALTETQ